MFGIKINVGGGGGWKSDGWICIDQEKGADQRVKFAEGKVELPYKATSVEKIYTSHFLEHFTRTTALNFLREFHRVLLPMGKLRIVVPCAEQIANRLHEGVWSPFGNNEKREAIDVRCFWLMGWGPSKFFKLGEHKSEWTPGLVYLALAKAGFTFPTIAIRGFQDGDEEMSRFDNPDTKMISAYVEAYKR